MKHDNMRKQDEWNNLPPSSINSVVQHSSWGVRIRCCHCHIPLILGCFWQIYSVTFLKRYGGSSVSLLSCKSELYFNFCDIAIELCTCNTSPTKKLHYLIQIKLRIPLWTTLDNVCKNWEYCQCLSFKQKLQLAVNCRLIESSFLQHCRR